MNSKYEQTKAIEFEMIIFVALYDIEVSLDLGPDPYLRETEF